MVPESQPSLSLKEETEMKPMKRALAFLLALMLAAGVCGTALAYLDDETNQEMFYYYKVPVTVEAVKSAVKSGSTAEATYAFGEKAADGTKVEYVHGWYSWVYVNEYEKADGTKDVWEDYADGEEASGEITSLSGTIKYSADRSDFSYLELRLYADLTDENGEDILLWPEKDGDELIRYHTGDQAVRFTITDAVPRKNVTCDFTLPKAPLTYGKGYQAGYSVQGLEKAENVSVEISAQVYEKVTHKESSYAASLYSGENLSGTVTLNAVNGNYIMLQATAYWSENGKSFYRSFDSGRLEITPLALGSTGWVTKNGKKYYGDSDGNAFRGLRYIDYNRYYFDENGAMVTGWFTNDGKTSYAGEDGIVYSGYNAMDYDEDGNSRPISTHIKEIDGEIYWFNDDYTISTGGIVDNFGEGMYYLGEDGRALSGWIGSGEQKYYAGADRKLVLGWATIGGKKYYFQPEMSERSSFDGQLFIQYEGTMYTGIKLIDGKLYQFDDDGSLIGEIGDFTAIQSAEDAAGLYEAEYVSLELADDGTATAFRTDENDQRVVLSSFSWKITDGKVRLDWTDDDGNTYPSLYLGMTQDGTVIPLKATDISVATRLWGAASLRKTDAESGWTETADGWTYTENGQAVTGWKEIGADWYYFDETSGIMATGWKNLSGVWYYFDEGAMAAGWKNLDGAWYYFDENGGMVSGWKEIGGTWYYFDDGAMAIGWKYLSGAWYYFDDGAMTAGWKYLGGTWYYFDDGAMATGWKNLGGAWYFFENDGTMANGWKNDGGTWYYFSDGAMVTGWKEIGGQWEMFSDSGAWLYTWDGN